MPSIWYITSYLPFQTLKGNKSIAHDITESKNTVEVLGCAFYHWVGDDYLMSIVFSFVMLYMGKQIMTLIVHIKSCLIGCIFYILLQMSEI